MILHLHQYLLLISFATTLAKDEDLPLCPSNIQYLPQNLPMHCRMPNGGDFALPELPHMPTMPPFLQNLGEKSPYPPAPLPFPGMPGAMPLPGAMPMPGPMPIPMMPGVPPHKLPVIVMPFYSPDPSHRKPGSRRPGQGKNKKKPSKKKPRYDSSDSSCDSDTVSSDTSDASDGSSEHGYWKGKKAGIRTGARRFSKKHLKKKVKKHKELLTPILQYVTKDGYVIFEKKISKGEAKDWLKTNDEIPSGTAGETKDNDPGIMLGNVELTDQEDPKIEAEELDFKEKSNETKKDASTQKYRMKKHHRARKPNLLINPLPKPGPQ